MRPVRYFKRIINVSNIVKYGTGRIISEIPPQILEKAFNAHPQYGVGLFKSRAELIADEVIRKRVIVDCNIVGGEQRSISLDGIPGKSVGDALIYKIPLKKTGGRHIISVMGLETTEAGSQMNSLSMVNAANGPETLNSSKVELVGPNCIAVETVVPGIGMFLRCMLANDPELSNFNQKSYLAFGELCVLAAKSIIYNKLIITLGESGSNGGNTNAATQSIIDSYADATELYNEFINKRWRKISMMTDTVTNNRILEMISY